MSMRNILIISHDNSLYDFIKKDDYYAMFFNSMMFSVASEYSQLKKYDLVIIDLPVALFDENLIADIAVNTSVAVCLDSNRSLIGQAIEAGAMAIIPRPYDIHALYLAIKNGIQISKMKDSLSKESSTTAIEYKDVDYLTQLPNRRKMYNCYDSLEDDQTCHFMYVDIDNFKTVNDLHGHAVGDTLLIQVTNMLKHCVHDATVYRVGGDEFVVMINGEVDPGEVVHMAQLMGRGIKELDVPSDVRNVISLSIGIITNQHASSSLDDVLYKCDASMYEAKRSGKGKYVMYSSIADELDMKNLILKEKDNAFKNGEFVVYLQPKINIITGKIYGAEALSRWKHPEDGIRTPGMYIDIFEECGFIRELDFYNFEQVCKLKRSWAGTSLEHLNVSVNMSRLHLYDVNLTQTLLHITNQYQVNPSEIEIEFTESVFVKDSKQLFSTVGMLKNFGFLVSIDNFGAGYSTLSMLKDIPLDIIKIDRDFLIHFNDNPKSHRIIRSIISMAKDLRLEVMAEGVETLEQIQFLTGCGCEIAQGFFYSPPIPVSEFVKYIETHPIGDEFTVTFPFNGSLADTTGNYVGIYDHNESEPEYVEGVVPGKKAIHFVGGPLMTKLVELPQNIMDLEHFSVSFWMKTDETNEWTSVFYVGLESGFLTINPKAWSKISIVRVHDERSQIEWFDSGNTLFPIGEWVYVTVTFSARYGILRFFMNGKQVAFKENIPGMSSLRSIYVGGDVYQESYKGSICDLTITDQILTAKDIADNYHKYRSPSLLDD